MGFTEKFNFWVGEFTKNQYRGGNCQEKGGRGGGVLRQFADLRAGLPGKKGLCF